MRDLIIQGFELMFFLFALVFYNWKLIGSSFAH
nr:MAG TPA: hypothetical protein [Caudoviricetes sp.]